MVFLIERFGLFQGWLLGALFVFLRYAFWAGLAFLLFYKLLGAKIAHRKIQKRMPQRNRVFSEIEHSLVTAFVFALTGIGVYCLRQAGYTRIYLDFNEWGWVYLPFSFVLLTVIHDTYFYWMHRLIHHPRLFPVFHRVHHLSHNPTPWAALSFHPLESFAEIAIIPIAILMLPLHPLVIFLFSFWALFWNVVGHLGYEIFPAGFTTHPFWRWFNTATHHNLHHQASNCNFGLYYNFWDQWMGTNHPRYLAIFQEIHARPATISDDTIVVNADTTK